MSDTKPYCYAYPRPAVTVDIVLFAQHAGGLCVLLIRRGDDPFKGAWALPGGFVDEFEDLLDAAARELEEETGITGIALEQLGAFGKPGRDPRGHTVSIAYGARLNEASSPTAGSDAADAAWHPLDDLPRLAFDHAEIIALARSKLLT